MSPGTPGLRYLSALSIKLEKICSSARRSLTRFGSGLDANLGVRLRRLMRHRGDDGFDQFAGVDLDRLEFAPSLAGEVEDRGYQAVHLGDRRFDESQRLGEILRELLVVAFEHRLGLAVGAGTGSGAAARPSAAIRRKMSSRNSSSSLVKPMMFTSGERRS